MMVQVPMNQCAGIVIYLLAVTGICLLDIKLSSVVAEQVIVLAQPYLDNSPPKLSLIERRHIEAIMAIQPLSEGERRRIAALETPSPPANVLAGRLDFAEREVLTDAASPARLASAADGPLEPTSQPSSIAARVYRYRVTKFRTVRSSSRYTAVTARDVFNRSFGVLSVAAN
jgi:hypothetical protein